MQASTVERRTLDIPEFARWLGISRSQGYAEARKGSVAGVPVIRIGTRLVVPRDLAEHVIAGHVSANGSRRVFEAA